MPNNVDERDFYCTLCFDVFFYPVTLPCKHRFCKDCFDNHVKCNSFTCPLCRARLSNWIRKLNQTNANIVDSKFWETVQKIYPKEVEKRRNGDVDGELSSALINAVIFLIYETVVLTTKRGEIYRKNDKLLLNLPNL
ncbi:hypothetical protein J6590_078927 [Homalodisca vitripennis]|nr:hypothetical protein J6590_078927 [Homalodisca vitripennis]